MNFSYVNTRKEVYYLQYKQDGNGKSRYLFSQTRPKESEAVTHLPEGYEVYEHPNTQVYLRKITKKVFRNAELDIIRKYAEKRIEGRAIKYDLKDSKLTIFVSSKLLSEIKDDYDQGRITSRDLNKNYIKIKHIPLLRISAKGKVKRVFRMESCTLLGGRIPDWSLLGQASTVEELCSEYLKMP